MDDNRVRNLGLIGGGGALVIALGVAALGGRAPPAPVEAPVVTTATATPSVSAVAPIPSPAVETAMAGTPPAAAPPVNPNLEFIVRFDERHPMSGAQALYLQGKRSEAEAAARATLAARRELSGLCFQRFTLGAEVVLAHCERVPRAQVRRTSERWVRKLKAMPGVQYADANVIVQTETKR